MPLLASTDFARDRYTELKKIIEGLGYQIIALSPAEGSADCVPERHYVRVCKEVCLPSVTSGYVYTREGYGGLSNFLAAAHRNILEEDPKTRKSVLRQAIIEYFETDD